MPAANSGARYLAAFARRTPFGLAALLTAVVCGSLYLALVEVPLLVHRHGPLNGSPHDSLVWLLIPGSGIAALFVLLSLALESCRWPALAAAGFLLITENLVLLMMPVWTLMILGGKSSVAAAVYGFAMLLAAGLLARRLFRPLLRAHAPRT